MEESPVEQGDVTVSLEASAEDGEGTAPGDEPIEIGFESGTETETETETGPLSETAAEGAEKPKRRPRRRSARGGGGRRTASAHGKTPDGEGERSDQADLLETGMAETGSADDDGERNAEAPGAPRTDAGTVAETAGLSESPPVEVEERQLDLATGNDSAEIPIVHFPGDAAVPHDRMEQSEERDGDDEERMDKTSRTNGVDVGAGDDADDDDSRRKGWWQRLLE